MGQMRRRGRPLGAIRLDDIDALVEFLRAFPGGSSGGYSSYESGFIRSIFDDCDGAVSWGGDSAFPDESHFQVSLPPSVEVESVAEKFALWADLPSVGAGTSW